jgi:hypothetical protein
MARLPRRCDHLGVIAIGEHLAAAPPPAVSQRSVDVPRRGDLKSLHPSAERRLVIGFHQHMHVVALQADMNDPEPLAKRGGDRRIAYRLVHFTPPKTSDGRYHSHHHMQRVIRPEVRSRLVALPGMTRLRLSPGTAPLPAAPEQLLLHMPLSLASRLPHHDVTVIMSVRTVN